MRTGPVGEPPKELEGEISAPGASTDLAAGAVLFEEDSLGQERDTVVCDLGVDGGS